MNDLIPVFRYLFDWRFLALFGGLLAVGLLVPVRYLRLSRSVRFNVGLFLVVVLASAIGTLVPQNKPAADYLAKFGPFWTPVFDKLGFFNVYHTGWFAVLLALMAFDVVVCKLRRLPMLIHGPKEKGAAAFRSTGDFFRRAHLREEIETGHSMDEAARRVREWLRSRRLRFSEERGTVIADRPETLTAFFTGRQRIQRWGDFVLHVSIVAVLAGGLLGAMFGFEELLPIAEGTTVKMENRPFSVTLKDFEIEYYRSTGAPSLYASDLVVEGPTGVVAEKRIVVNEPLDIDRVRFYQASWGVSYLFRSAVLQVAGRELTLRPKEAVEIPGTELPGGKTPLSVRANRFIPTFDVDEHGHPTNRDHEGRNPALQIDFLRGERVEASVWVLQNEPGIAFRVDGDVVHPTRPPPFRFASIDPILLSVIQVGYDPGAPVFWLGAIFLLTGLCLHFYLHQRRLRILLVPSGAGTAIQIGGWNSRDPAEFRHEFAQWTDELRRDLQ